MTEVRQINNQRRSQVKSIDNMRYLIAQLGFLFAIIDDQKTVSFFLKE
jgi:hypothetical protein